MLTFDSLSLQLYTQFDCQMIVCLICYFLGLKEPDGKPKVNHVTVFERPGLREFLKQVYEFADLVLFTAGVEGLLLSQFHNLFLFNFFISFAIFFYLLWPPYRLC